ncbi:MAG: TetR family transcriptional regulator [Candidatus Izemoplasmatales bacterium]
MKNMTDDRTYFLKKNRVLYQETLFEFANKRFPQASLNEIIRRSSFNKGSFYYRFKDKNALYFALLDDLFVTQYSFPETQMMLENTHFNLKDVLQLLFVNLYWTYKENPLYLQLLKNYYTEKPSLKDAVKKECIRPVFSRFFDRLHSHLKSHGFGSSDPSVIFIVKDIEFRYFCIEDYLSTHFGFSDVERIVDDIIASIDNKLSPRLHRIRYPFASVNEKIKQDEETSDILSLHPGEIVAIVGQTELSLSGWVKKTIDRINDHSEAKDSVYPNCHNWIFLNLNDYCCCGQPIKNTIKLRLFLFNASTRKALTRRQEKLLKEAGLLDWLEKEVRRLPLNERVMAYLIKGLLNNSDLILVDRVLEALDGAMIQRFFAILLKYRQNPCTMILVGLDPVLYLDNVDRLACLVDGTLSRSMTPAEIRAHFEKARINIHYDDFTANGKVITFEFSQNRHIEWIDFVQKHRVYSIDTKIQLDLDAIMEGIKEEIL